MEALIIIPSCPVWRSGKSLIFDRKFYDGMLRYVEEWTGAVITIMRLSNSPFPEFGYIEIKENDIPFSVITLSKNEKVKYKHLKTGSIVLASGDSSDQLHVSHLCKKHMMKCVYVIEYILETRYQIMNLQASNPIIKLRRQFFIWNTERKRRTAFKKADGIQANGVAAYNEYKKFGNCLLYFDTRIFSGIFISNEELNNRLNSLSKKRPLRLAYSGRLISMKGADHLIEIAIILKRRKVDFNMTIYGDGELKENIIEKIQEYNLSREITIIGTVDFYNVLIPEIKNHVDLYLLLHRQSDPSCTYLETLSCGIPIVGYANKAFSGLLQKADIGWAKSIDDLEGIADIIEFLDYNRDEIRKKSTNSVIFSREHDFETTYKNRIKHIQELVN